MASNILFLCTGNICRSPVAEAVARRMYGGLDVGFHSGGLDARSGLPASPESRDYGRSTGAPLEDHCSRPVSFAILSETFWVIGMTRSHAAIFRSRFGHGYHGGIGLLGAPGVDLNRRAFSPEVEEVVDPYGGTAETYQTVCDQIRRLLTGWESYFRDPSAREENEP